VVQPIISEDGWLSLAARACPDQWAGPPRTMRLEEYLQMQDAYKDKPYAEVKEIAKEIKDDLCSDPNAYVWVAIGHRKDQEDTIGYGWYKKSEDGIVAKNLPGNQARVRAIKRWVREVFPEAKSKMKDMTATWMERAGDVRDIQNVIEAEYHIVTEEPPAKLKGSEKTVEDAPPGQESEGDGFNIDLTWLNENLKVINWTEDTTKTWLVSQYKVSSTGTLEAVLKRLTRTQAEEFIKEIQGRAESQATLM